jgi:hypothetical protein
MYIGAGCRHVPRSCAPITCGHDRLAVKSRDRTPHTMFDWRLRYTCEHAPRPASMREFLIPFLPRSMHAVFFTVFRRTKPSLRHAQSYT